MKVRRRDELGAVALLVALLSIALFAVAALAVDLSNAFVRKRDVQAQADFAALAGASKLGSEQSGLVPNDVVAAVRDSLNTNLPQDDKGQTAANSSQLTDGSLSNGEVRFANGGLQVVGPPAQVNYSFARVMGFDKTDVTASATVGLFSPGPAVMPMYAVDGCDYGSQSITVPASGLSDNIAVPTLVFPTLTPSDANNAKLNEITAPDPAVLEADAEAVSFTIAGTSLKDVSKVGFFRNVASDPDFVEVILSSPNLDNDSLTVTVPGPLSPVSGLNVTEHEDVWFVRVFKGGKWSKDADALAFVVGDVPMQCAGASNSGNFGPLRLARADRPDSTTDGWLPANIAAGLESPLSLSIYPTTPSPVPAECDPLDTRSIYTPTTGSLDPDDLKPRTNCIDTATGLSAGAVTAGLITGVTGYHGRLNDPETEENEHDPDCNEGTRAIVGSGSLAGEVINNDVLSCFLDEGVTLSEITLNDGAYGAPEGAPWTGEHSVISSAIFKSPRFFWMPVLAIEPTNGGSEHYSIVDFRPAFLTGQPLDASVYVPWPPPVDPKVKTDNGIRLHKDRIIATQVVFFDVDALPASDGEVLRTPYMGVGPREIGLID